MYETNKQKELINQKKQCRQTNKEQLKVFFLTLLYSLETRKSKWRWSIVEMMETHFYYLFDRIIVDTHELFCLMIVLKYVYIGFISI